jgi:membrane protein DedA with SNARE-associated domain
VILVSLANEAFLEWLRYFTEYPVILAIMIVIATFILEDVATIGAGLLALDGYLDPQIALGALIFGIAVGDLGLYGLGAYASGHPRMIRLFGAKRLEKGRRYLDQRLAVALISARMLPGMRMPTYIASGFLGVSFLRFSFIAIIAASIWATVFFTAILLFGRFFVEQIGDNIWILGITLLLLALILPRAWQKRHPLDPAQEDE